MTVDVQTWMLDVRGRASDGQCIAFASTVDTPSSADTGDSASPRELLPSSILFLVRVLSGWNSFRICSQLCVQHSLENDDLLIIAWQTSVSPSNLL